MARTTLKTSAKKTVSVKSKAKTKSATKRSNKSAKDRSVSTVKNITKTAKTTTAAKVTKRGTPAKMARPAAKIPNMPVDFYYSTKKFWRYFLISLVPLLGSVLLVSLVLPDFEIACVMCVSLCALYTFALFFGFIAQKQQMVRITNHGINIDNYPMLKWDDVRYMTIGNIHIMGRQKGPLIFLHAKNLRNYQLTHMQKMCIQSGFTAFSIPLYFLDNDQVYLLKRELQKYAKFREK